MSKPLPPSAQKIQEVLQHLGISSQVLELPQSTRTAAEAAQAVGCAVGQIVKSLVFRGKQTHKPILVLASGANRVNEKTLARLVGEPIEKADADFVREQTGFSIGGVPPIGHIQPLPTYIDEDLLQYEEIWAAAGTPHAVFPLTPADLVRMTGGTVIPIT
ncbi:MAG: YbaK/EbsC family protein [Chloroflexi bacterium]|nr:YbaK/EbsC family protein [Chloroflexota bacterium]